MSITLVVLGAGLLATATAALVRAKAPKPVKVPVEKAERRSY